MSAHLTEEEQIEAFKRWWKENGKNTLTAIVLALAVYFGWQGWQNNQQAKRENASVLFQQMSEIAAIEPGIELSQQQLIEVASLGEQLKDGYAKSFYAVSAAMLMAKYAVDQGNLDEAKTQLGWAKEHNRDAALTPVIDLRLARLHLAAGELDQALALVKVAPATEFGSSYAEVRGDVLAAQGDTDGAREAYQLALDTLPDDQSSRRRFLLMKRDQYATEVVAEAE
ncbi:tetratricopeptide repeat protein [Halioxenophilus sp. WMMB6]|uniref:YfgM family protein n=1 Tax=Halioxenophilus sp. WMMB6 TaxID=3073815 RepID=UPI00295E3800|nr:tetratricopeptide repeat protein [Halioxenophilus sp. WMMB6]